MNRWFSLHRIKNSRPACEKAGRAPKARSRTTLGSGKGAQKSAEKCSFDVLWISDLEAGSFPSSCYSHWLHPYFFPILMHSPKPVATQVHHKNEKKMIKAAQHTATSPRWRYLNPKPEISHRVAMISSTSKSPLTVESEVESEQHVPTTTAVAICHPVFPSLSPPKSPESSNHMILDRSRSFSCSDGESFSYIENIYIDRQTDRQTDRQIDR